MNEIDKNVKKGELRSINSFIVKMFRFSIKV